MIRCPKCGSDNVKKRKAARVAGATVGGVAGGLTGAAGGAEVGAVVGALLGPVGAVVGAAAGGTAGAIFGGVKAGLAGIDAVDKAGRVVKHKTLHAYKCRDCATAFSDPAGASPDGATPKR